MTEEMRPVAEITSPTAPRRRGRQLPGNGAATGAGSRHDATDALTSRTPPGPASSRRDAPNRYRALGTAERRHRRRPGTRKSRCGSIARRDHRRCRVGAVRSPSACPKGCARSPAPRLRSTPRARADLSAGGQRTFCRISATQTLTRPQPVAPNQSALTVDRAAGEPAPEPNLSHRLSRRVTSPAGSRPASAEEEEAALQSRAVSAGCPGACANRRRGVGHPRRSQGQDGALAALERLRRRPLPTPQDLWPQGPAIGRRST